METCKIDPLQDPRWAEFVQHQPRASVFHTPGWLRTLRRTYGYEPVVLTTAAPGEPLQNGLVFCRIRSWLTGYRSVSIPFSDHCDPLVDDPDILRRLLSASKDDLEENDSGYLEMRPIELTTDMSQIMRPTKDYCFHQLHLRPDIKSIFHGFHKNCVQRKILRAQREGLVYEEGRSERLLDQFYSLMVLTRRRHHLVPQPRSWFVNLISEMGEMLKIRIASRFQIPVAAILTLCWRDIMVYKYGCSDPNFKNLGGIQLVLWEAIQEACRNGLSLFDFGRSDCDNSGLIAFKDRWGTTRSQISYLRLLGPKYSRSVGPYTSAEWGARVANIVFPRLPDCVLRGAGNLIYRHIG